jgi:hypothetical protein
MCGRGVARIRAHRAAREAVQRRRRSASSTLGMRRVPGWTGVLSSGLALGAASHKRSLGNNDERAAVL